MFENYPKLMPDTKLQIQEAQRRINTQNKTNKNTTHEHVVFQKILKEAREEENLTQRGTKT